jgi:hypothetical protein
MKRQGPKQESIDSWDPPSKTRIAIYRFPPTRGHAANNSLSERLTKEGMPHLLALVAAGRNRLRPIAMTTIAAALALLPLALALGQGAEMQQPLAIAIISGLAVQMPLVLLIMPFGQR